MQKYCCSLNWFRNKEHLRQLLAGNADKTCTKRHVFVKSKIKLQEQILPSSSEVDIKIGM